MLNTLARPFAPVSRGQAPVHGSRARQEHPAALLHTPSGDTCPRRISDDNSRIDRMTVAILGSGPKGGTHADGNNYGSPPMFLACRTMERQAERRVLKTRSECEHGSEAIRASGPSRAVPKRRGPGCHKETLATAFPSPDLRREASFSTANPCDPPGGAEEAMMKSALPHDMAAPSGVSVV